MSITRKIIEIDEELCNGCGNCITTCAEGALELIDGKAKLVSDKYCDGLGACLGDCPTGALKITERDSDDFDADAVEERLHILKKAERQTQEAAIPCGCPSAHVQTFERPTAHGPAEERAARSAQSALAQWPVQIRLVPSSAPFLKNAHLLVAADCTPFAYANFHEDFLKGKVLMVGCPKFDNAQQYLEKFVEIFEQADIRSVTTIFMEVPCCHGLPMILKKAMEMAGKKIPMEHVVIGVQGEVLQREKLVA